MEVEFKYHKGKSFRNLSKISNSIDLSCLTNEQKDFCEIELGEKELLNVLKSMSNNKITGNNDGLRKSFMRHFGTN